MAIAYSGFRTKNGPSINTNMAAIANTEVADIATTDPILNIHVACKDVVKLDVGSPSDPMCVLFIPGNDGKYVEIARTEVIWDNPNPAWVKFFQCLYIFETHQPLHFEVYDCDSEKASLKQHDLVGKCDTDVQSLVSAGAQEIQIELKHPTARNKRGTLIINVEQATQCGTTLNAAVQFRDLKKMHTFSRNNPFLVIAKPSESGRLLPTHRTEVLMKCQRGQWKTFVAPLTNLCNGDIQMPLTYQVYDFIKNKPPTLIGQCVASISDITEQFNNKDLQLKDARGRPVGFIKFTSITIQRNPTFYDYIRSGLQLNLVTAVDFTASNRVPSDPRSLHYLAPDRMNQYENCIYNVGSILCPYDSDQLFPVYGFGGKVGGQVSHCFPLTFDPANPNVQGLQNILGCYRNALANVQLSGPTLFAPIIRAATDVSIASWQESHTYTILMILTDGVINDMPDTIDAIVNATDSPLSIIIVGIGDANFDSMDVLDADDVPLKSRSGKVMKRDIVQFVPFNKFARMNGMGLATEVLAEVPRQVDQFCRANGFIPQY